MMRGGAHGINADHDRTDRAIDNRIRRDVGGGVDDVTHRKPPSGVLRTEQKVNEANCVGAGNCLAVAAGQPGRIRPN